MNEHSRFDKLQMIVIISYLRLRGTQVAPATVWLRRRITVYVHRAQKQIKAKKGKEGR